MESFGKIDLYQTVINGQRPFEGDMLKQIRDFYRVGITYTSNAIEGNSLTESETKVLIEDGLTVGGKPLREIYEALDHAKAYDYMFTLLNNNNISEQDILTLHQLFYQNIEPNYAGKYRDIPVFISGSKYPVSEVAKISEEMMGLCEWINNKHSSMHPVEFAAQIHKRFIFIHPFKDGNGRVARLILNTVLIQNRFLPVIIPPILRSEYIYQLERAHENDRGFIEFIASQELESQKDFMRMLHIPVPQTDVGLKME